MGEAIYWDGNSRRNSRLYPIESDWVNLTGWKLHDRISIYEWKMGVLKVMRVLVTFLYRPYIRLGILPIPIPPKKDLFVANRRVHLIKYWNFEILALDSNSSTSKLYTKWSF